MESKVSCPVLRGFSFITKTLERFGAGIYMMKLAMPLPSKRLLCKWGGMQQRLENIMNSNVATTLMLDLVCFTLCRSVLEKMCSKD